MNYGQIKNRFYELGFVQYKLAIDLSIPRSRVSDFFAGRRNRISKKDFKKIYRWLVDHNVVIIKPRPKCICPFCLKPHVASKSYRAARLKSIKEFFESFNQQQNIEHPLDEITQEFIALANMYRSPSVNAITNNNKEVPVRASVVSGSADSFSAGRQGNLPEQSTDLHEPAQLQTDGNNCSNK